MMTNGFLNLCGDDKEKLERQQNDRLLADSTTEQFPENLPKSITLSVIVTTIRDAKI